jgi:hypothetical protein
VPHLAWLPVRFLPHPIYIVQQDQSAPAVILKCTIESVATLEECMHQRVSAIEQHMAANERQHTNVREWRSYWPR